VRSLVRIQSPRILPRIDVTYTPNEVIPSVQTLQRSFENDADGLRFPRRLSVRYEQDTKLQNQWRRGRTKAGSQLRCYLYWKAWDATAISPRAAWPRLPGGSAGRAN